MSYTEARMRVKIAAMIQEERNDKEEPWGCPYCGRIIPTYKGYIGHLERRHRE